MMSENASRAGNASTDRAGLRRRVLRMYDELNTESWGGCFELIDPALRDAGKVDAAVYAESLAEFKATYGEVRPWYIRMYLHLDGAANKRDPCPFAYVYVVWQDAR